MAVGKNKRISKGGKKGGKKKTVDPFTRKEWYNLRTPACFQNRNVGKTCANKTIGNKLTSTNLMGRCYELNQGDIHNDQVSHKKFKLICEDVDLKNCKLMFYGMEQTRDKQLSIIKKWQTLINCNEKVTTTDGYTLRFFMTAITKKAQSTHSKTCYAQSRQTKAIRKCFRDQILALSSCDSKSVIQKLLPDSIAADCLKNSRLIYPLQDCITKKVKVLKRPAANKQRVDDMHDEVSTGAGGNWVTDVAPVDSV